MTTSEYENLNAGATDLKKEREANESKIRKDVGNEFPTMSPDAQEAIIQSRLGILYNPKRPTLIQSDLGENAGKKSKEDLFE